MPKAEPSPKLFRRARKEAAVDAEVDAGLPPTVDTGAAKTVALRTGKAPDPRSSELLRDRGPSGVAVSAPAVVGGRWVDWKHETKKQ